jgi:hypothetical protein
MQVKKSPGMHELRQSFMKACTVPVAYSFRKSKGNRKLFAMNGIAMLHLYELK